MGLANGEKSCVSDQQDKDVFFSSPFSSEEAILLSSGPLVGSRLERKK
jgi:hypothetical protein